MSSPQPQLSPVPALGSFGVSPASSSGSGSFKSATDAPGLVALESNGNNSSNNEDKNNRDEIHIIDNYLQNIPFIFRGFVAGNCRFCTFSVLRATFCYQTGTIVCTFLESYVLQRTVNIYLMNCSLK
jgi:hypothetical protein